MTPPVGKKVLLVTNPQSHTTPMSDILAEGGPERHTVQRVERLSEAVRRLEEEAFDLVVLDVAPGPEILTHLRTAAPKSDHTRFAHCLTGCWLYFRSA